MMDSPGALLALKWEKTHPGHICTIVQNFTPIGVTVAEVSVTNKKLCCRKEAARCFVSVSS